MLLDPIIGFAKSRSVSWPPVENGIPDLDTDRPKAFKQTLSCPNSPVRIESEEKWADEVGGTITESKQSCPLLHVAKTRSNLRQSTRMIPPA